MVTIGGNLKLLRQQKKLTLSEASKEIGIGHKTLSKYEKDEYTNQPNFIVLFKIATFYGVSALKLLDNEIAPLE